MTVTKSGVELSLF